MYLSYCTLLVQISKFNIRLLLNVILNIIKHYNLPFYTNFIRASNKMIPSECYGKISKVMVKRRVCRVTGNILIFRPYVFHMSSWHLVIRSLHFLRIYSYLPCAH